MSGVDVLAVILRHSDSHRQNAGSDAYSAQEAPKLERAYSAVAELIEAAEDISLYELDCPPSYFRRLDDALRRVKGEVE